MRQVLDRWRGLDVTVRDLPLALLIAAASFVPGFHGLGTDLGQLPERPFDALAIVAVVLQSFPLAVRRRWPAATLVLVLSGFAVDQLSGYHTVAGTGLAIGLLSAGVHLEHRRRTTMALLSGAYVAVAVALEASGAPESLAGYVMFYVALVIVWTVGTSVRSTRLAEAERRERVARDTRTAERTRIARELHDVVTHHVTAMVVQAESARYLTAVPDRLDETLTAVTDTGREAISDLRNLLDLLDPGHDGPSDRSGPRPDPSPVREDRVARPSETDIRTLVKQTRRAGQPVELTEDGGRTQLEGPAQLVDTAEQAGAAERTVYRVVQEALTNALKHAPGRATTVDVGRTEQELTVRVSTAGSAAGSGALPLSRSGSGRGLVGLRERVEALGGEFGTELLDDGGFVVRAVVPRAGADLAGRP